jgi:hypothetical protein
MIKRIGLLISVAALAIPVVPANAAPLLFTFSDTNNSSFQLDSNPVSAPASIFSFTTAVTNGMQNGAAFDFGTVRFFSSISGGGVFTEFGGPGGFGPQLYSGTTAAPVFSTGTFSFTNLLGSPNGSTLTISAVAVGGAVPEPATWAMMIFGFGAVGSMLRYRRRSTTVTFG